ncbi:DUF4230 domain-containing protein [Aerococcus viridans]
MKNIASILKSLVFLLVIGGAILFLIPKPDITPQFDTNDIEATISDIGELATSEYRYTISQTAKKDDVKLIGISIPFTSSHVLYSYQGVIKAGIQFGEITIHVNETDKTVFVELPETEILSEEVFQDSLIVYNESYSPFNTFTFSDMNLSVADLKDTAKKDAVKNGLLDAARENAITILNSTVNSFYDTDEYTVEYH